MFTQILVPTDFSPSSDAALALARERFPGASLRLLHVLDPRRVGSGGSPIHAGEAVEDAEAAMHGKLKALAGPNDETAVLVGDPADRILWATDHWHPELVLMGTHGRTGLAHLLVGSVAEAVVRKAHVPVLVTKQPDQR
ncbi:MAG: universal stress protein [Candidatus Sericytochromatia bacterium]